ncbi:Transposon Ty3-G Gag-Pol poly, partial [Paramuricea clavata]
MNRQEIEEAYQKDLEMQALITAIRKNRWPRNQTGHICNELTVSDNGIIQQGNRLVMPKKLRSHTLNIAHAQHQAANNSKILEPLKMTTMPFKPSQVIHGDVCGPFPSGDYLLVLMDKHARFPEVEIIRLTTTAVTIGKLEKIFSVHGFPIEFVSDEFN